MITIELGSEDFDANGFVKIWKAADAILKAMGHVKTALRPQQRWHPVPIDGQERWPVLAQHEIWAKLDAAVAMRLLQPIDPDTHTYRARGDFADAVVPLSALIAWGRKLGLYDFARASPAATESAADEVDRGGHADGGDKTGRPLDNWMMRVQAEATRRWREYRKAGCNPTAHSLKDELAKWCRDEHIRTKSNINPSPEYLYRHVLSSRHWKPPTD